MSTGADFEFDGVIIDLTGRRPLDDSGNAIAAAARHASNLGQVDRKALLLRLNRDRYDGVLTGPPSEMRDGKTREFQLRDIARITSSPDFKKQFAALRDEQRKARLALISRKNAEAEAAARVAAELEAERRASPHLWGMVEELQNQLAALLRAQVAPRDHRRRSPILEG